MYVGAVTDVTSTCDVSHRDKFVIRHGLRAYPAGVTVTAGDGCHITQVQRMLEGHALGGERLILAFLLAEYGMAGVAVFLDDLAIRAFVAAVMTAEAPGEIEVPDVVVVGAPINFHLGKTGVLVDTLQFGDGVLNVEGFALFHVGVLAGIKTVDLGCNSLQRL